MTEAEYDEESLGTIEWTLRLAELHNDAPWQGERGARGANPGAT